MTTPSLCATCPFFVKRVNAPRPGITFDGECHKSHPCYIPPTVVNPEGRVSSFIPVRANDWCGEHPANSNLKKECL